MLTVGQTHMQLHTYVRTYSIQSVTEPPFCPVLLHAVCPAAPTIGNGSFPLGSSLGLADGYSVSGSCDDGYAAPCGSEPDATCQNDGNWSVTGTCLRRECVPSAD